MAKSHENLNLSQQKRMKSCKKLHVRYRMDPIACDFLRKSHRVDMAFRNKAIITTKLHAYFFKRPFSQRVCDRNQSISFK